MAAEAGAGTPGSRPCDTFEVSSVIDHARAKGMWAGEVTQVQAAGWQGAWAEKGRLRIAPLVLPQTPALLTVINEILVNACDQAKATAGSRGGTTRIDVAFDEATGEVAVANDGPGIPVAEHAAASAAAGRTVYTVEAAFSIPLAGSNITKSLENVKGGVNGLGAKLANVHSVVFEVATVDARSGLAYAQTFRDRLRVIEPPRVAPRAAGEAPSTRVRFTPAYAALGYGAPAPPPGQAAEICAWLRFRALQTAAYLGRGVEVVFNGAPCEAGCAADLGRLLLDEEGGQVISGAAKAAGLPYSRHPWDLAVVVLPPGRRAPRRAAEQNCVVVNGVSCSRGSHVDYVRGLLAGAVEARLAALQKKGRGKAEARPKGELLAGVRLVLCGAIPGADWGSQGKAELKLSGALLERWRPAPAFLREVAEAVALQALDRERPKAFVHDKYTPARHAGSASAARRAATLLLAAEGDSAISFLRAGLTQSRRAAPPGGPSLEWCGIISLQGVVANALRQVTEVARSDGSVLKVASAALDANVRLRALADALGLRKGGAGAGTEGLKYGRLVLCVDQDLDGTGKIASLVLVWIHTFWPELLRAGRVGRLMTPLVRAYPRRGGEPAEFFYEAAFERWLEAEPGRAAAHRVKYYKGLAGHSDEEIRRMFEPAAFARNLFTFTYDGVTDRLFEVYFGRASALRKAALATPVAHLAPEAWAALEASREIPLGAVQLGVDTKAYKLDAIRRQVSGAVDGLLPVHRKILAGAAAYFAGHPGETKVYQLSGIVSASMFYHHGSDAINGAVIGLAQAFPGARRYPLLRGVGQFGSRHAADDAGSPRYISVRPSAFAALALPPADRWHLPYDFVESCRAEPRYFVPVVPLALLEGFQNVSEGWRHARFARALGPALAAAEAFARGEPALVALGERLHAEGATPAAAAEAAAAAASWPLPAETRGFLGAVREVGGVEHAFGAYAWAPAEETVFVSDLPPGVVTEAYLASLEVPERAALIAGVENLSPSTGVDIRIRLRPGAFAEILGRFGSAEVDPVEDAFQLHRSLAPALNFVGAAGGVFELPAGPAGYLAALAYWGVVRRDLYRVRLERELAAAELRAAVEEASLRYIAEAPEIDVGRFEDDGAAGAELAARGFPRLDLGLIRAPCFAGAADLRRDAVGGARAGFDYLLGLRGHDFLAGAARRRAARLAALRAEAARLAACLAERPHPGASVWLAEIAAFRAAAEAGPDAGARAAPGAPAEEE